MSNPPVHPFVDPNEYERNKKVISSYRSYLEMYEQVNEQGLRNHEEMARMEQALQEKIRQGEEARRQLELLKQNEGRMRITDGRTAPPAVDVFHPRAQPVVTPYAQTAYIEEVNDHWVPSNTSISNYNNSHSMPNQSRAPQPTYYNQHQQQYPSTSRSAAQFNQPVQQNVPTSLPQQHAQSVPNVIQYSSASHSGTQFNQPIQRSVPIPQHPPLQTSQPRQHAQSSSNVTQHPSASHSGAQLSQPTQRNVPTPSSQPPQQNVQVVSNVTQYPKPRQSNTEFSQQAHQQGTVRHTNQMQQVQPLSTQKLPAEPTFTQREHRQQPQQQNRPADHAKPIATLPPRYHTYSEALNHLNRNSTPNQVQGEIGAQPRQNVAQNTSVVNTEHMQNAQIRINSQASGPLSTQSTNIAPTLTPAINVVRTASSLDGALGSKQSTQPTIKPPPPATISVPEAVASAVPVINSKEVSTRDVSSSQASSLPLTGTDIPRTPVPSTLQSSVPDSTIMSTISAASPKRTPKEADKRFLARDLLRALKRPRPESSSTEVEPGSKRHASSSVVRSTEYPEPLFVFHPLSVTPYQKPLPPKVHPNSVPPPTLQPTAVTTVPSANVPKTLTPYYRPSPLTTAVTSPATQTAPVAVTSVSKPTETRSVVGNTVESTAALMQGYPYSLGTLSSSTALSLSDQTRARINHIASFGRPSDALTGGSAAIRSLESEPPVQPASEQNQVVTVAPVARVPLQPLTVASVQTATQGFGQNSTEQPLSTSRVQPELIAPASVSSTASASASVPEHSTPSKASPDTSNAPSAAGTQCATAVEIPETLVHDSEAGPSDSLPPTPAALSSHEKVPLFLPSPTESPQLSKARSSTDEVSNILLPKSPKGKGRQIITPSTSSVSSSSLPTPAHGRKSGSLSGRNLVFDGVLVPPLPEYAKAWKRRGRPFSLMSSSPSSSVGNHRRSLNKSRSPSLGDFAGPPRSRSPSASDFLVENLVDQLESEESDADEELDLWDLRFASYDDAEKEVLHENAGITKESLCKWVECDVLLNSSGALLRHLIVQHGPKRIDTESPWTCQWSGCGHTFISTDDYRMHMEKHAMFKLWCPYIGCDEQCRTTRQLIKHKRSDHSDDVTLRPTVEPMSAKASSEPGIQEIPKTIPSYVYEYSHIRPASITRQRHEAIMPTVLRRISGNVPVQLQSYNAARPMPEPLRDQTPPPTNTPYSFLVNRSTRYSSHLSSPAKSRNIMDLGSSRVTELVTRGLVLWPEKDGEAIPEAMVKELESAEVDEELDAQETVEGYDVFGPTIAIEAPGTVDVSGGGDVGFDGSGVRS